MPSTARLIRRGAALAGLALALSPALASADSLVVVKDYDVWLSKPDGTGLYQVTSDGTYATPYRSPSQADDGTIAVGYGDQIVRMRQNGTVLNRLDPPALMNSVSHPMDGAPVDVAISPDGKRIAWSFYGYECPAGASCGTRAATGYTAADHLTPPGPSGTTFFHDPSWVSNTRTLQFGGYGSQVNTHDVGAASAVHWFDDSDYVAPPDDTDLGDGELNRQGTKLALIRGYGDTTHVMWYSVSGSAVPTPLCATNKAAGFSGPTWSPDGTAFAYVNADGIAVKRNADDCASPQPTTIIPGGSEPDWGPANVNPGPRGGGSTSSGGPAAPGTAVTTLAIKKIRLAKALKRGLRITLTGAKPGKRLVVAKRGKRVVARGTARVGASGNATVTLRFTRAGKRALRKLHRVKLTISGPGVSRKVTLRT
jgi:hypothetical protein